MAPPPPRSAAHYRRRILGLGALATFALYVIGAPFFNNRIEDDLERRVPAELADAGFAGVAARFSGQDGTLTCREPLDDPEFAIAAAYDVWGVRAIELDRSCRVNSAPTIASTTTVVPDATDESDATDPTTPVPSGDGTEPTVTPTPTTIPPDFATVADIVMTDPQFALLAVLVDESGLGATLAAPDPGAITLFAPTDAAFDELPADVLAELRTDPDRLGRVLSHHAVAGRLTIADLTDGLLQTLAGGDVAVAAGETITIGGAALVDADIAAGNGIVHVIDRLLVPDDIDLTPPQPTAPVTATYDDGAITFTGVVASEVERAVLTAAAGPLDVIDELEVDPDVGLDETTTAQLARLVEAMSSELLNGVAGFDGSSLHVAGSYPGDNERDAMTAVADSVGAVAELEPRPDATDDDAIDLEAELNAFVAENPILFEPGSAELSPSADAVIDRIALEAQQFTGVAITVEGHTDSDGVPIENLILSRLRANAVRDALVARGIDAASITAEGFGSDVPVLVDGVEDKAASRRVEFRVVATP
jgi:outer membrane protein OmpA-like peptidoglycan-associated protein/uncharacterized surface protein with fasciclin (FAS1) repeats